jgi:glycosyltransferase involved in cell wall biosynthesis
MSTIVFPESQPTLSAAAPVSSPAKLLRVLHLINGEHYSGAERVQDLLALRLPEYGIEVAFGCLKPGRFGSCRESQNTTLYDVTMRSRWDLEPARRLARLVKQEEFQLIHTHTPRAATIGMLTARMASVPLVHHLHSPTTNDSTHRLRNGINAVVERLCLSRASAVIAVSRSLGDYARRQHIDPKRIFIVPNGVPTQGPLASRSAPTGVWTLGTVALFRPRKGLEILLESLAALRAQGCSVRLLAVGGFETDEYHEHIRQYIHRLKIEDAIEWTGFTRDVQTQLRRCFLAYSAKACQWSCSKRWSPECRWWQRAWKESPKPFVMALMV